MKEMLSLNEQHFRDSIIIRLGVDEDIREGNEPVDICVLLASERVSLMGSIKNRCVEAPMVLLEGDRQNLGITDYYMLPPLLGDSIPLEIYLSKWAGFARLLLSSKKVQGIRQSDYAYALLCRAVDHCRQTHGVRSARNFVQALHDTRWSVGSEMTAELFTVATQDRSTKARSCIGSDHQFLMSEISALRNELMQAKDSCQNLTEWCEALYSVNPRIWAILGYLRESDHSEAEKWYRYFAEVDADIAPCSLHDVATVILSEIGESGPDWKSLFLASREKSSNYNEFKQELQYLLHSRTCIPRYWYDLALNSYDIDKDNLPDGLSFIDKWKAVSVDVLRASSMEWLDNAPR